MPQQQNNNGQYSRKLPEGMNFRSITLRLSDDGKPKTLDLQSRSVEVVVATENAVRVFDRERWEIVNEVLLMSGCQIPDSRQVVLLDTHYRGGVNTILGSGRQLQVVGGELIGRAHYSSAPEAEGAWTRTQEGHLTDYSAGYEPLESVWIPEGQKQRVNGKEYAGPLKVTTLWRIKELSACPIGADEDSKSRSSNSQEIPENPNVEERTMPENKPSQQPAAPATDPQAQRTVPAPDVDQIRTMERQRLSGIRTISGQFKHLPGIDELTRQFEDNGNSADAFAAAIAEKVGQNNRSTELPDPVGDLGMSQREKREFSFLRAARVAAGMEDGGFETEVSQQIGKQLGRNSSGIFVPTSLDVRAPATAGTAGAGGYTVDTVLMPIIELLKNRMMVRQLGAQVLDALQGNLSFPKQLKSSGLTWQGENPGADAGDNDMTDYFGQIGMSPKSATATNAYSKQFLAQSSLSVEQFFRNDLSSAGALGLDLAAINGSGGSDPRGILSTAGIGLVPGGDNGATPAWSHIVKLETEVAIDNADIGNLGYLTNAKVRGILKETERFAGTGRTVWADSNEKGFGDLNGYRAGVSNQVPSDLDKGTATGICSAIIYGNWGDLLIGEWGVMEIIADQYRLKKQGLVELTLQMLADVVVRRSQSFSAMVDALTE